MTAKKPVPVRRLIQKTSQEAKDDAKALANQIESFRAKYKTQLDTAQINGQLEAAYRVLEVFDEEPLNLGATVSVTFTGRVTYVEARDMDELPQRWPKREVAIAIDGNEGAGYETSVPFYLVKLVK